MTQREKIESKCDELKSLLISKDKAYGSAATDPLNIFFEGDSTAGIRIRIDDKLKRIKNSGVNDLTEDTVMDLAGYLILLMITRDESNNISERLRENKSTLYNNTSSTKSGS